MFRPGLLSTCEVWGRSDILRLSYNNFYSHGETSNFVTPQGHAFSETQDLHNLTSQRPLDDTDQIIFMSLISRRSSLQSKTCHFLLPAGGAMTIAEYGHVDLSGQESYQTYQVWGRSDIVWLSYYNFLFHGESSKFVSCHGHALQRKL